MSSTNAIIHAAQDLICVLKNTAPVIPLFLVEKYTQGVIEMPSRDCWKSTSLTEPPRVPVQEAYPEKIQQINQAKTN